VCGRRHLPERPELPHVRHHLRRHRAYLSVDRRGTCAAGLAAACPWP
jgi:hypothetical protein